jgi:uncharacterized membrane protein YhhN
MVVSALLVAVATLLLLFAEERQSHTGKWIFKPAASTAFVAMALFAGALDSPYGIAVLVALCLSWLGDVLLIPKDKRAFKAGVLAFLAGHLGFGAAFVLLGVDLVWTAVAAVGLAVVGVVVGRWIVGQTPPKLKGAVVAYIVVISVMVALGVGVVTGGGHPLMLVAAVAFYLSDITVARNRFMKEEFVNRLVGLPLYYGAQVLFAFTIVLAAAAT